MVTDPLKDIPLHINRTAHNNGHMSIPGPILTEMHISTEVCVALKCLGLD